MDMFLQCGWPAYLVLLCAVVSLVLAVVALVLALVQSKPAKLAAIIAVAIALLPAGVGALGTLWGRHQVEQALPMVDPAQRDIVQTVGYTEASQCLSLGMGGTTLPLALSVIALLVAVLRSPGQS